MTRGMEGGIPGNLIDTACFCDSSFCCAVSACAHGQKRLCGHTGSLGNVAHLSDLPRPFPPPSCYPSPGPLWDVISQKLSGGSLKQGSELVLEVAEARLHEVHVDGSLLVYAENVVGHLSAPLTVHGLQYGEAGVQVEAVRLPNELAMRHVSAQVQGRGGGGTESFSGGGSSSGGEDGAAEAEGSERLVYSSRCGRVHMSNVTVRNLGIDWAARSNLYWKHQVTRREAARVVLQGRSEFEAHDVVIDGDHTFTVPDGFRMVLSQGSGGSVCTSLQPLSRGRPSWEWAYSATAHDGAVKLEFVPGALLPAEGPGLGGRVRVGAAASGEEGLSEYIEDYVI